MTPARGVTTTAATTTTTVASATAAVLGKRRRGADQHRPQNAGCEKKATALGTHDCHLPLRVAPLHAHLKPINSSDLVCITRFRLFGVQQSLLWRAGTAT
jgi:hypothetical protein